MPLINYAMRDDPVTLILLEDAGRKFKDVFQITSFQRHLISPDFLDQYYFIDEFQGKYTGKPSKISDRIFDENFQVSYRYIVRIDSQVEFRNDYYALYKLGITFMPAWGIQTYLDYFKDRPSCVMLFLRVFEVNQELNKKYLIKGNRGSSQLVRLYDGEKENSIYVNEIRPVIPDGKFSYLKNEIIHLLKTEDVFISLYEINDNDNRELENRIDAFRNANNVTKEKKFNPDSDIDMAKIDYDNLYSEIVSICPNMEKNINYIKNIQPARIGEYTYLLNDIHQNANNDSQIRLIDISLRFALKNALYYYKQFNVNIEDAFQEACLGIIYAIRKYSFDLESQFSAYAGLWMTQNMNRSLPIFQPNINVPAYYLSEIMKIFDQLQLIDFRTGIDDMSYEQLVVLFMQKCNYSLSKAEQLAFVVTPFIRIDTISDIDETDTFMSRCNNEFQNATDIELSMEFVHSCLDDALNTLNSREKTIIIFRYGLYNNDSLTLAELGKRFGLTRERVRQIESSALNKLSSRLINEKDILLSCLF